MRFATKILLLTLAITIGLSATIVWVVSKSITPVETQRARDTIDRAIEEYERRLIERGTDTRKYVHLLLEDSQNRAYLQELDASGANAPETAVTQLRDEIFGRLLQQELVFGDASPALHVVVNRRGLVALVALAQALDPAMERAVRELPWPSEPVIEEGLSRRHYLVLDGRLYIAFAVPLRVELTDEWTFAYFVAYEINDAWVRRFLRPQDQTELRVVAELDGKVIARSAPTDAAEQQAIRIATLSRSDNAGTIDIEFNAADEHFLGEAMLLPTSAGTGASFAFFSSLDRALEPLRTVQRRIAIVTAVVVLVAVIVSRLMSRYFAKPVEQLVAGTERIARGEFDVPIDLRRGDELGVLARSFNQMAAGLEQRDLIKDTFGKFVDPAIVQSLLDDPTRLKLGGERRVQTILFADLENFSALGERLDPEALFELLNGYLEGAADVVAEHRGIIDKFIGDGVVAFWGPPMEERHALMACRAALKLVRRTFDQSEVAQKLGLPPLRVRVGVATGEVLVGNIGSKSKYNYTVMGDVANLASRLEGVNKLYGTQILVTDRTRRDAGPGIVARRIDTVRVIGRREPVELWELLGESDQVNGQLAERMKQYESALNLYLSRQWSDARAAFDRLDDPPARAMAGRCAVLADQDPTSAWDGVWNLDRK
jgi:class 3 adenylate cyclase